MKKVFFYLLFIVILTGCNKPEEVTNYEANELTTETTQISSEIYSELYKSDTEDYEVVAYSSDLLIANVSVKFKATDKVVNGQYMKDLMTAIFTDYKSSYDRFSFVFSDTEGAISMFDFEYVDSEMKPTYVLWMNEDYKTEF